MRKPAGSEDSERHIANLFLILDHGLERRCAEVGLDEIDQGFWIWIEIVDQSICLGVDDLFKTVPYKPGVPEVFITLLMKGMKVV